MLSKEELAEIRSMIGVKSAQWQRVGPKMLAHIDALEKMLGSSGTVKAKVGFMQVEVDPGKDKKFGTKDDKVKLSIAKKSAPKKAPAKKAPAKKGTSKKR